jgi:hypothetical protein
MEMSKNIKILLAVIIFSMFGMMYVPVAFESILVAMSPVQEVLFFVVTIPFGFYTFIALLAYLSCLAFHTKSEFDPQLIEKKVDSSDGELAFLCSMASGNSFVESVIIKEIIE